MVALSLGYDIQLLHNSYLIDWQKGGRRGSVGKSTVLTQLGMLELVVQTPLLPGMSMCAFLY